MKTLFCAALVLAGAAGLPSAAATLNAFSQIPAAGSFSIDFNDLNGNGLFEIGELTNFSGLVTTGFGGGTWTVLSAVPDIAGFTLQGALPGVVPVSPFHWSFSLVGAPAPGFAGAAANWTYQITGLPAPVPLPAGLPLLAGAIALLAARRRTAAG